jgi:hypothetical protein
MEPTTTTTTTAMAPEDRRQRPLLTRPGGRRIRDDPKLRVPFERALFAIAEQLGALQERDGLTLAELAGDDLSAQGVLDIQKLRSDPKISTLVRLAARHGCELSISFRPQRTQAQLGKSPALA